MPYLKSPISGTYRRFAPGEPMGFYEKSPISGIYSYIAPPTAKKAQEPTTIYRSARAPAPAPAAAPTKPSLPGEARTAWEKAIEQYAPGGGYGRGVEAALGRGEQKATAGGMQKLVSAGLAGTTEAAGLTKKYEEEIAMPARARVEETRAQAVAQLQAGLAAAEQRGYETAEERALRERLSASQLAGQERIAGAQTGLGYAQLGAQQASAAQQTGLGYAQLQSQERMSSQELAMQEILAKMKMQQPTGGYGEIQGYWD